MFTNNNPISTHGEDPWQQGYKEGYAKGKADGLAARKKTTMVWSAEIVRTKKGKVIE